MERKTVHWQNHGQLVEHFKHHFDLVTSLFTYDPWKTNAIEARALWLDRSDHIKADRKQLVQVLTQYNQRIGNHRAALEAIAALAEEQTLTVVGGQQAGLFTGPLLVIYKAITLIQAARKASRRLSRKVVPIFWIAGEDHDFDEVNHIYCLSKELSVERIKLSSSDPIGAPVSNMRIDAITWEQVLQSLDDLLLDTEFKNEVLGKLRELSLSSLTLTDQFARLMAWLFGEHGLILLDSADPAIRRLEAPMFEQLVQARKQINQALMAGRDKLQQLGYQPTADVASDGVNLFVLHEGRRVLLYQAKDRITDRQDRLVWSESELMELAGSQPEQLSNNVFTRPLMQEYLFPVLQTVLGPGEISYWSMLQDAFQVMNMNMPIILPRQEYTLIEGTVQKHMAKYGLSFEDVVHRFEQCKQAWLTAQDEMQLEKRFTEVKRQFAELYDPLIALVGEMHNGIRKLGETNKQKIEEQIEFFQAKSTQAFESQHEAALRQLDRIQLTILPLEKPQERVYNMVAYLNKYGMGWIDNLLQVEVDDPRQHSVIYY